MMVSNNFDFYEKISLLHKIEKMFDKFDKDESGFLDNEEMKKLLLDLFEGENEETIKMNSDKVLGELDQNGDNELTLVEILNGVLGWKF
jgi:Ca2+-binding EF-hand superfamily protein